MDASGNTLWQEYVKTPDRFQFGLELLEMANGDLVVGGLDQTAQPTFSLLMRAKANGDLRWLTSSLAGNTYLTAMALGDSGRILVGGNEFHPQESTPLSPFVAEYDSLGGLRNSRYLTSGTSYSITGFATHQFIRDRAGNLHLVGSAQGPQMDPSQGYWNTLPASFDSAACHSVPLAITTRPYTPFTLVRIPESLEAGDPEQLTASVQMQAIAPCPPRPGCNLVPPVTPFLGADSTLCLVDTFGLRLSASLAGQYLWSTGDTTHGITVRQPNIYSVAVQTTCALLRDTIHITALPAVSKTGILASGPLPTCQGDSVTLTAQGRGPYVWSDGYRGNRHKVGSSGLYSVTGSSAACQLLPSDTLALALNPRPLVAAGPAASLCDGDSVVLGSLTCNPVGTRYRWQPDTYLSDPKEPTTQLRPRFTGADDQQPQLRVYRLTVTDTTSGCASTDSATVNVYSRYYLKADGTPYCLKEAVVIPNIITPNGDDQNDFFEIKALAYYQESSLTVYNRYGREVYSQAPYTNAWSGQGLPAGVYYYRLTVPKPGWEIKGWVEVVR